VSRIAVSPYAQRDRHTYGGGESPLLSPPAGTPMGPDFEFDLTFAKADRGELIVEAWIIDLDTSATRKLTESLEVNPRRRAQGSTSRTAGA